MQLYHHDDVALALLYLQREFQFNANMILYFCWYAYNGQGSLNQTRVRDILLRIRPWHERIVLPLRRIRDRLKPYLESKTWVKEIRQAVLLEELEAEHAEQLIIVETGAFDESQDKTPSQKCIDICRSLLAYARVMRTEITSVACDNIAKILATLFSQIPAATLQELCRKRLQHNRSRGGTAGTQMCIEI